MTVAETILADLARARGWVCGSSFYASFRPTFSQRISEVNAAYSRTHPETEGSVRIVSRVCRREGHDHKSTIHEYALREFVQPQQLRLEVRSA